MKGKTRAEVIAKLESAEMEEGRSGLVAEYLANNPEEKKEPKKK